MPAALPIELRQRVVNAYKNRKGYHRIAEQFDVSVISVRRWVALDKKHDSVKPKPFIGGPKPKIEPKQFVELIKFNDEHSDLTLAELAEKWSQKSGKNIHRSSIWRALNKANVSYKKNFSCR